jgi:hypothetical protein
VHDFCLDHVVPLLNVYVNVDQYDESKDQLLLI